MKISVLGPSHSYCHIVYLKEFLEEEIILCSNIEEIYRNVSQGKSEIGLAPIENMLHGSVRESIIALEKYKAKINKAFDLPIHHCLASKKNKFTKIISHPQALGQCLNLLNQYRDKVTEETSSTSKAMEIASRDENYAALGSKEAALYYKLKIWKKNVEDNPGNKTRFILISKNNENQDIQGEKIRTSFLISPERDKPGLLYDILTVFKEDNINLTKIESIPTGKKLGEYSFFIEIDGSLSENKIENAVEKIEKLYPLFIFGSYAIKELN